MEAATLEAIRGSDHPIRRLPRLYGKVQAKYPGRWLSHVEAFGALIGTCDDSERGRRDELVLRLGLSGL
ncbi:MAG TPA: hypothetical protein VM030_06030, partial [Acidimicrobiales bacterium]|nr:hypothetical protein [Acidimicrobiales bacterium]